jgi:opacity protein-like surface antigen
LSLLCLAARGQAQTSGASDTSKFYVEFDTGASLGHRSSGFFGGEAGYRITGPYAVFVEGGYMPNVGTSALDEKAKTIADFVGATSDARYKIGYFDAGLRYTPSAMLGTVHPYLAVGFGFANVNAQTTFFVNGAAVPPESLGIATGSDLEGSEIKGLFTVGGGVTYPFGKRYFVDGSFRYGYVMSKGSIENDTGINTFRLSIGAGVAF